MIPSADDDPWNLARGVYLNRATQIRFRPGLESYLGSPSYKRRLIIKWSYFELQENGLPEEEQSDELGAFEDSLVKCLDYDRLGVLAFVFTSAGVREWHFYVKDINEVKNRLDTALERGLPIDLEVVTDENWSELQKVIKDESRKT